MTYSKSRIEVHIQNRKCIIVIKTKQKTQNAKNKQTRKETEKDAKITYATLNFI